MVLGKGVICLNYYIYYTDYGNICICESHGKISNVSFGDYPPMSKNKSTKEVYHIRETPLISKAAIQISQYLQGRRTDFSIPLALDGTDFQLKVWRALTNIPYGATSNCSDLARYICSPRSHRAIYNANAHNPISIIIPSHRILKNDGQIASDTNTVQIKESLLNLEKRCASRIYVRTNFFKEPKII